MKNIQNYILTLMVLVGSLSLNAQEKAAYDTTFHNSYYDMRQEIYNAMPDTKGEIIFLGNSITERVNWSELFQNGHVINRGIGGDICWGVHNRLDEVLSSKPKKIFLLIGINDIGKGIPSNVIAKKYEEILVKIKTDSPKTKIVLQNVLPINEDMIWYDYMKGKSPKIIELNNEIARLATRYNLPLINIYDAFADDQGKMKAEYTSDGLHLNGKGYMYWVGVIKQSGIKVNKGI